MSVSLVEMAGHERDAAQSSPNSKKRKHTDQERAEGKRKKKQKHLHAEASGEVLADPKATQTSKKNKRRREATDEAASIPAPTQQEARADIELPDVEEDAGAPTTQETTPVPKKKKKRKALAEDEAPFPAPAATGQEQIELLDEDNVTPPPVLDSTTPALQPTPPSNSTENSPFHVTRASFYVPCPAISLSTALQSLISTHLTPLLLTYYPPLNGIVLSITSASLSSKAASEPGKPLELPTSSASQNPQLALCADDNGVSFAWLSFTATTFHPTPSSTLSGHINIASEGFIGLVLYNYFQVGIARNRIPRAWKWNAAGSSKTSKKQPTKGRIRDAESEDPSSSQAIPDSQATAAHATDGHEHGYGYRGSDASQLRSTGYWTTADGSILKDNDALSFRVVDCDIVPSSTRHSDKMALQIEGTLLDEEEEEAVRAEERAKFDRARDRAHGRTTSPRSRDHANMMSGGLGMPSREGSAVASAQRHRVAYG